MSAHQPAEEIATFEPGRSSPDVEIDDDSGGGGDGARQRARHHRADPHDRKGHGGSDKALGDHADQGDGNEDPVHCTPSGTGDHVRTLGEATGTGDTGGGSNGAGEHDGHGHTGHGDDDSSSGDDWSGGDHDWSDDNVGGCR